MLAEKANFPIAMMCRILEVSRSGFYDWTSRPPSRQRIRAASLRRSIRRVHETARGVYGSPRVHAQLQREGVEVCRDTVARLMRAEGLRGEIKRGFKSTTDSKHPLPIAPNSLNREFDTQTTDSAWCADITYLRTKAGWVYLAVILDLATRLVVGWSMATHMRTPLVVSALMNALSWRKPAGRLLHHSDRGSQYASRELQQVLRREGIECSMSRKGNCWDNAVTESFFGTFKQELAFHEDWNGLADARAATCDYIESFYNRERLHSTLGYKTPMEADELAA